MAKRLKNIQIEKEEPYPWDKWFDGATWEFTLDDFPRFKSLNNVRIFFLNKGNAADLRVVTSIDREREVLQIQNKGPR